ncbi:MAG TPA: hypothetical protein VIT23_16025 [Terrimicrobiaceae bacterium]
MKDRTNKGTEDARQIKFHNPKARMTISRDERSPNGYHTRPFGMNGLEDFRLRPGKPGRSISGLLKMPGRLNFYEHKKEEVSCQNAS